MPLSEEQSDLLSEDEPSTHSNAFSSPEFIFVALIVGVQTFMAYNGGATSATIDSIEEGDATWGALPIGFLGAMDKFGMTVSSPLFGLMFQFVPAKTLLATGLVINAGSCLIFGSLRTHAAMFAAKILIGITEGLQWVWAPQWIDSWASVGQDGQDKDARKQLWMNLNSSVVAGVGAGLGIIVAGLGTDNGLSYGFAFRIEAGILFLLWLVLLTVNGKALVIPVDGGVDGKVVPTDSQEMLLTEVDSDAESVTKSSILEQICDLWSNKLFCRCAVGFASSNFVIAGMQFLWVRFFTCLWGVSKTHAVFSQLIVIAAGGAVGVTLSTVVKFTDGITGPQRLAFTTKALVLALCGALIAILGIAIQLKTDSIGSLAVVYLGIFVTCAGLSMTPGLFQIICIESVEDPRTRTFGTGVYQGLNNFLGFAMGPCIPQVVMSLVNHHFHLQGNVGADVCADPAESLRVGFICALCGVIMSLIASARAWCAALDEDDEEDAGLGSGSDEE